jgi:hypothetical protein
MIKKSYQSRRPEASVSNESAETLTPPSAEEGLSGEPGSGVGRGLSLPGEPAHAYDADSDRQLMDPPRFNSSKRIDSKELLDLFVMLADEMDKGSDYAMANFADFMIKKIAEQRDLDYSALFKDLLIKIVESDVLDKNKLISSLVSVFNRVVALNINNGASLSTAKLNAYQAVVSRAEEHVR